jgi:hypothetical protein
MVACILAIAVLNIGLGFALAVYLARPQGCRTVGTEQGATDDWSVGAPSHRALAPQETRGHAASVGPFSVRERGIVPQTVEGLKTRVQQCNEYLTGLESQVVGTPGGDSCGVAQSG